MTHPVAAKFASKFQPSTDLKVGDRLLARRFYRVEDHRSDGPVQGEVTYIGKMGCLVQPLNPQSPEVIVDFGAIVHRYKS